MKISRKISLLFFVICLFSVVRSQSQKCQNPNYIIPYDPIDDAFDATINTIRGQDQLVNLIQNPNESTFKDYMLSLAPFSAPLFAMAGVTFAIFIATIVQVICFNSCGKE